MVYLLYVHLIVYLCGLCNASEQGDNIPPVGRFTTRLSRSRFVVRGRGPPILQTPFTGPRIHGSIHGSNLRPHGRLCGGTYQNL